MENLVYGVRFNHFCPLPPYLYRIDRLFHLNTNDYILHAEFFELYPEDISLIV